MDLRQAIFNNLFWRGIGLLFVFLNNILIVRILGVEVSGQFYYSIAMLTFIVTCLRFGLENGITYVNSKYPNSSGGLIWFIVPFAVVQAEVIAYIIKFVPYAQQTFAIKVSIIFVLTNIILFYISAFYTSQKMFKSMNMIGSIFSFLQTVILVIFYFQNLGKSTSVNTANQLFIIQTILWVLQVAMMFAWYYNQHWKDFQRFTITSKILTGLFRFSGMNFLNSIFFFLITRTDYYFIEKFCDPIVLGNYIQASKIGQMVLLFPLLIGNVVFPFVIDAKDFMADKVALLCRLITFLFLLLAIALFALGQFIFPWMLGDNFTLVADTLLLYLPGLYFMSLNIVLLSYFEGINKQFIILVSNVVALLIVIVADSYYVPKYGYKAAATIFSVANLFGTIVLLVDFEIKTRIKFTKIFNFSKADLRWVIENKIKKAAEE